MKIAELIRPGVIEFRDVEVPRPGPGELVIRVDATLTCGTDLKTFERGHAKLPMPLALGHETAGTIVAAGKGVTRFREGDPVACVPTAPCGECRLCTRGRDSLCAAAVGRFMLGAFAEYVRVPAHIVRENVFLRPPHVSAGEAAALEPLSCVVHGSQRIDLQNADTVVIIGDGAIALMFAQVARLQSSGSILLAGKHEARLEIARRLDFGNVINVAETGLQDPVMEWTGGKGADVVVECVGRPDVWESAATLAGTAAEVLLFGGCAAGTRASFDTYRIHYDEVDIKGAFHYGRADVRAAWDLLRDRLVDIAPLITHELPLSRLLDALELARSRTAIKVAVAP